MLYIVNVHKPFSLLVHGYDRIQVVSASNQNQAKDNVAGSLAMRYNLDKEEVKKSLTCTRR